MRSVQEMKHSLEEARKHIEKLEQDMEVWRDEESYEASEFSDDLKDVKDRIRIFDQAVEYMMSKVRLKSTCVEWRQSSIRRTPYRWWPGESKPMVYPGPTTLTLTVTFDPSEFKNKRYVTLKELEEL